MSSHASLTGTNLHAPFPYEQDTDPGAVGAGKFWADTANNIIRRRNAFNTGWASFGGGSAIEGYTQVPSGVTTAELQAFINGGGILVLPNETLIQTASLRITNDVTILGHPSGLSELRILGNTTLFGTNSQLLVGWNFEEYLEDPTQMPPIIPAINVVMRGFKMSHSRADVATRTGAIRIGMGVASCEMAYMYFEDITESVCTQTGSSAGNTLDAFNISLHDCIVNEWFESVFISLQGSLTGCWCYNNYCTTTLGNILYPTATVSKPYGFGIDEEHSTGFRKDVVFANNIVDARGAPYETMGNSLGLFCTIDASENAQYDRICWVNNYVYGFWYGIYMNGCNNSPDSSRTSFITFESNHVQDSISNPIWINMEADDIGPLAKAGDRLILAHNHVVNGGGPGGTGGITISTVNTPGYLVHDIGNTSTGI